MLTNRSKLTIMVAALGGFFTSLGSFYQNHTGCDTLHGYEGYIHLFIITGTFITSLGTALVYDIREGSEHQ